MSSASLTTITAPGLLFLSLSVVFIFSLGKRYFLVPLLISALFMTYGQIIMFGPFHFTILRVLILAAWLRMWIRGEIHVPDLNRIDKAILWWVLVTALLNTVQSGSFAGLKGNLGLLYNVLGLYGLFRISISDYDDINYIFKVMAISVLPVALLMLYESRTGNNLYSFLGGVPLNSMIRDGWVRSQGPFRHSILAGTFGATSIPFFIALYTSRQSGVFIPIIGIISSLIIVVTSHSSGPLLALISVFVGIYFWRFRDKMKLVRWGIVISLLLLNLIMKAPVWYIFARMSDYIGGGGWHRSYLIDQAVRHFDDWWLIGTNNTSEWFPYTLGLYPGSADITNAFVSSAVGGGLLTLILFIAIFFRCYQGLGNTKEIIIDHPLGNRFCTWLIGVSLFAHIISFISVTYFDQIIVFWYMLLAIIATITNSHHHQVTKIDDSLSPAI